MGRLLKISIGLIVLLIMPAGVAEAQVSPPASVTGHITAQVITMISAVETSQLNFGKFAPGAQGGELIISPESTVAVMGSVWPGTGSHNAASFYVTGDPGVAYTITLPSGPVKITHMGTAKTMTVENWTSSPSSEPGAGTLENGSQTVYIGATLKIGTLTDNPVGVYTGTYTVTFDFY